MSVELMPPAQDRDVSGFGIFSHGDAGEAHVMAHRMLDEGRHELGHRLLGAWLERHEGAGSDWTHLQWHMAVFEIAVGEWDDALARFEQQIVPVAVSRDDALTDAPSLLWRLWLSAPREVVLPWKSLHVRAARNLGQRECPYVDLHCLLAIAGARDVEALDDWLRIKRNLKDERTKLLSHLAVGLRAFAASDYGLAASLLEEVTTRISELGGSHAQNLLFGEIAAYCWQRAEARVAA